MLEIRNLKTVFDDGSGQILTAVDGVSFSVNAGSKVGIVGESGSGKSVSVLSVMGLLSDEGRVAGGDVLWQGQNLVGLPEREYRAIRGREIGLIFQNPLASLNPVFSIGSQFVETLRLHFGISKREARDQAIEWLRRVKIPDPEKRLHDYPHQFSLGMCQRIMIALTVSMKPKLLIADEPTASLDVTIQAQILDLIGELCDDLGMSVLMISHDLGVIAQHCDEVVVMYLGKVVESGSTKTIFSAPKHPYTKALIRSIPSADPSQARDSFRLKGDVPSLLELPTGCRFHTRCPDVMDKCKQVNPEMKNVEGVKTACFLYHN